MEGVSAGHGHRPGADGAGHYYRRNAQQAETGIYFGHRPGFGIAGCFNFQPGFGVDDWRGAGGVFHRLQYFGSEHAVAGIQNRTGQFERYGDGGLQYHAVAGPVHGRHDGQQGL